MQEARVGGEVRADDLNRRQKEINLVLSQLDEKQKRLVVGLLSRAAGWGGQSKLACMTGLDRKTIRRGCQELENELKDCPTDRVRREGAGRPAIEKKLPKSRNN